MSPQPPDPNYSNGTGVALAAAFFFFVTVGLFRAPSKEPIVANALIQKLTANFR